MIFEDLNVVLVSLGLLVPGESRPVVEQCARDTRLLRSLIIVISFQRMKLKLLAVVVMVSNLF